MKVFLFLTIFFQFVAFNYAQIDDLTETQILEKLKSQQSSWNHANLEGFMEAYHRSDSLKFIGRNGVTYGWDRVLDNYRKHYSSPEKMGQLNFTVIHLDALSDTVYRMIGSYELSFSNSADSQKGFFTLIWQLIEGEWLITSDQTSG
jgi:hypothetical protein